MFLAKQKILTYHKNPPFLEIKNQDYAICIVRNEGIMIEYHGIFTEISPYSYCGLNGFHLTFTCDSPFGYDTKVVKIQVYPHNHN